MSIKFRRDRFDPFADPTEDEVRAEQELDLIEQAVSRRITSLRREQATWAYDKQRSESELHDQALREVQDAVKREERAERNRRLQADVTSAVARNQHLFGSWMAGGAYAASGELGAVLAEVGPLSTLGGAGVAAAGAAATTALAWKRIKQLPSRHWQRLRAGVAAGCATCLALPVSPLELPVHASLLAAGAAAVVGSSVRYWRENAPAYPPMGGYPSVQDVATEAVSTVDDGEDDELDEDIAAMIADWNTFVRDGGILPGAELEFRGDFDYGRTFTVHLVRGKQHYEHLQQKLRDIAYALDVPEDDLSPDRNPDRRRQLEPMLSVVTSRPDTTYTGPVVVEENGSVFIDLGPYTDGLGMVRYELLTQQLSEEELAAGAKPCGSPIGGYVLGDKGSGKTRMVESIVLGAMAAGVEVWYLDPQNGASSPILNKYTKWSLLGLDAPNLDDPMKVREFGNVEDLLEALDGVVAVRQDENNMLDYTGFQHTRERPMILAVIDECHKVFGARDPDTNETYGERFGDIDRVARKLGVAFFGASQAPTQDVFGGDTTLRNGMAGSNGFLLKYNGSNAKLAFGALDDAIANGAKQLQSNRTLGYALASPRPHAVFQNRFTPDLEPFFKQITPAELDDLAKIGAGEPYARRHETAQADRAAVQHRIEGYRTGKIKPGRKKKGKKNDSSTKDAVIGAGNSVSYMFPGTRSLRPHDHPQAPQLTERQRLVLEMLANTAMSAKEIAVKYGNVTNRTISNDLRVLRQHKLVRVADEAEGRYVATQQV